ncbi:MAG: VOC family protein [Ginsengibacter sp.]
MKIDPIIAVKDVDASANWYQKVFGFRRKHGGDNFAVLVAENDEIVLCLHKWGDHHHPSMIVPNTTPGNGLILYFKTNNMGAIRENIDKVDLVLEEDVHENTNSLKKEFSLRDPDGYYLTITEYHEYEG